MNIKQKRKNLTTIFGITILCLLFVSMNVNGVLNIPSKDVFEDEIDLTARITDITFPSAVAYNSTFKVKVDFEYNQILSFCIYDAVSLIYHTTRNDSTKLNDGFIKEYIDSGNNRPESIVFTIATSELFLGEADTDMNFRFKIKYKIGYKDGAGRITFVGTMYSEYYSTTILKKTLADELGLPLPVWAICLIGVGGILLIAIVVALFRRRR